MKDREELIAEIEDDAAPLPNLYLPSNASAVLIRIENANRKAGGRGASEHMNAYRLAELRSIMQQVDAVFSECSIKNQVIQISEIENYKERHH